MTYNRVHSIIKKHISDRTLIQISKHVHVCVMPQKHYLALVADFLDSIVHQFDYLCEGLLSGGGLLWIDVRGLQEREEQFARTTVV